MKMGIKRKGKRVQYGELTPREKKIAVVLQCIFWSWMSLLLVASLTICYFIIKVWMVLSS